MIISPLMVRNNLLRSIALLFLLFIGLQGLSAVEFPKKKQEMRAVWLTTIYGLDWPKKAAYNAQDEQRQRQDLVRILDQLKEAGINTVFLQVRGRGTLIYPSNLEPMSRDFLANAEERDLGYDPLAFAIEECKKRGMALHVWYVVMPLGNDKYVKNLPRTVYARKHRQHCLLYQGQWYMNPARKETSEHMRKLVKELLDNYDVAGVHLDYIRYPDNSRKFPDDNMFKARGRGMSLDDWRRQNIETIVGEIKAEIDKHEKNVLLSAAVIGAYREIPSLSKRIGWTAYSDVYQDPPSWGKKGFIDFIIPMLYYKEERFAPYVKDWLAVMDDTPIVIGLGAYRVLHNEGNWSPRVVLDQMDEIESNPYIAGVVLFRAEQVLEKRLGLYTGVTNRWGKSIRLPYISGVSGRFSNQTARNLSIEKKPDGLHVSWEGEGEYYSLYVTKDCDEPDLEKDLYTITRAREILIPWSDIDTESTVYIKVGSYFTNDSFELLEPVGALYYNSEYEK